MSMTEGYQVKAIVLLMALLAADNIYARCNGNYADHILRESITCSGGQSTAMRDIPNTSTARDAVQRICMDGCYGAIFNSALAPDCDARYANVLKQNIGELRSFARSNNCTFNEEIVNRYAEGGSAPVEPDPFASCFYVTEQVVQPAISSCGNTPTCMAMGYCTSGDYAGEPLSLMCNAEGGRCPSFSACANAPDPSWIERGGRRGSSSINQETFNPNGARSQ